MQASRRFFLYASVMLAALAVSASRTRAEELKITSTPSGATVEINGIAVGITPYQIDYPGGYFHKTHSVFGVRLDHSISLRISKPGYLTQQIALTSGPFEWIAVNGRHHGNYYLLKSGNFEVKLEPVTELSAASIGPGDRIGPMHPHPEGFHAEASATVSGTGNVMIASDPPGAEIYVDGKFVEQTPSTIPLAAGSRHIVVKAGGRREWERDVDVQKDSQITLHPVLDQPGHSP
jgi:hypothetical protein